MHTRVLIADDRRRSRSGLRAVLALRPEIEIVGEAADGQEAVRLVEQHRPDVVLMDARMPVLDGVEATRLIKERWPEVRVVVLTIHASYRGGCFCQPKTPGQGMRGAGAIGSDLGPLEWMI